MTELQTLMRKIHLKRQAVRWLCDEIAELRTREKLLQVRAAFEKKMAPTFDPVLSRQIDVINFLLEADR